ncbi:hypothetical protein ABDD95_20700 [Mucilaginibacter sp. PAMB04274]|uniref:hypothetical protein n=1 Tax=Mucilaginibacter sp. PAMB04274 TaxID=3138568 RepID=UPI003333612E
MKLINPRYLLSFAFVITLLNACVQDKPKNSEADKSSGIQPKVEAKSTYAAVNTWLDDFKNFRTAVYQQDVQQMKTYFNFPIFADTTQVWVAIYDNVDESKRPQTYPATFTEADLEKQHGKLFNDAFVQSLLKVKSEQLYQKGEYTTPVIKAGDQSFHMIAHYDKATASLQLSLMFAGWTDKNGEEMSEGESAIIYFFKVVEYKYLKFDKILFAG